jgi:hypothetical protein
MNESCQWQGSAKGVLQDAEQDAVGKILRKVCYKVPRQGSAKGASQVIEIVSV